MAQCYDWRSRAQTVEKLAVGIWVPCPSGNTCCVAGSICLDHNLCHTPGASSRKSGSYSSYYVARCTDPTYTSPDCQKVCNAPGPPDAVYNYTSTQWNCCGTDTTGNVSCNNPTSEVFQAPAPADLAQLYKSVPIVSTATLAAGGTSSISSSSSTSTGTSLSQTTPSTTATDSSSQSQQTSSSSSTTTSSSTSTGLSTGAKAGIAVGIVLLILGLATLTWFLLRRRRRTRSQATTHNTSKPTMSPEEPAGFGHPPSQQKQQGSEAKAVVVEKSAYRDGEGGGNVAIPRSELSSGHDGVGYSGGSGGPGGGDGQVHELDGVR